MKSPILGGSYVARSVNAACDRMVNLFAEAVPEGGKTAAFLNRCPGMRVVAILGTGPIRGLWKFGDYGYAVSGSSLYRVDSAWNSTLLGTVTGSGPVSMSDNGTQLFVACNPDGFIYNATTGVFAQITDVNYPGAVTVGFIEGFFVFNQPDSQNIWTTGTDGLIIGANDNIAAYGSTDSVVALNTDHNEVWVFGSNSVQVFYYSGAADSGLSRIQGAFMEIGCKAPYSIAKLDNSLFWLGSDDRGNGIVYRANGYTGLRVSTHAIEYAIQSYAITSDAIGFSYQQEGHAFYVLSFPSASKTWVFDVSTGKWHERAGFLNGEFTRWPANCMMNFGGEIVVGDYANGNLHAIDLNVYEDGGATQKWLRSWRALPPGTNNLKRTTHHSLQLDCESGVGLDGGANLQGNDPQVMLRWSDDGGHTWSNEHWRSMGKIGEYGRRVIWRRLGMTDKLRDRVYEISGTDPVKLVIMGAELDVSGTTS